MSFPIERNRNPGIHPLCKSPSNKGMGRGGFLCDKCCSPWQSSEASCLGKLHPQHHQAEGNTWRACILVI